MSGSKCWSATKIRWSCYPIIPGTIGDVKLYCPYDHERREIKIGQASRWLEKKVFAKVTRRIKRSLALPSPGRKKNNNAYYK
jgi:hypothetical protein